MKNVQNIPNHAISGRERTMFPIRQRRSVLGAALVCLLCTDLSFAQGSVGELELEEIVVTAQRREQSLQDVPVAMTVFGSDAIVSQRIETLDDYLVLTPNVTFNNGEGTRTSFDISVRGLSNIGGNSNVFGIYVDEFNVAPARVSFTLNQALLDVERIEVLRGPQGTFFGRNVTGGAVNITTKKPGPEFGGNIMAEAGSFDTFIGRGSVNVPLNDKLFMRVSGNYEYSGGFLKNEGPADVTNDQDNYGARLAFRALPSDDLTVDFSLTYNRYDQGVPDVVPTGQPNETFQLLGFPMTQLDAGYYPQNTDTVLLDQEFNTEVDALIATANITYEADTFRVVSVLGMIDADEVLNGDNDWTDQPISFSDETAELKSRSAEIRIESSTDSAWSWMAGALYAKDETGFTFAERFGPGWSDFLSGLFGVPIPVPDGVGFFSNGSTDVTSYGLFGELARRGLDDRLNVSLSARWARDEVDTDEHVTVFSPVPPFGVTDNGLLAGSASFTAFLPRLAVTYELDPSLTLYAVAAQGGKPGGFNLSSILFPAASATFDQEKVLNFEIGFKGLLAEDRLRYSLALFYMDWTDIQVDSRFNDPTTLASVGAVDSYPDATSQGVEIEFEARVVDGLTLQGGIGYTDATFGSGPEIIVDTLGNIGSVSGNQLPLAAKWTGNLASEYRFPLAGNDAFLRAEYIYQGEKFTDVDNEDTILERIPQYDTVNLRTGIDFENLSLVLFAENLTNQDYTTGTFATESFSGVLAVINPRRFGVRASYRF